MIRSNVRIKENPMGVIVGDKSRAHPLARAVRARRKQLGLRQKDVADLSGVGERFVYSVEAGKETLRLDKLLSVLEVLGLGLSVRRGTGDVDQPEMPAQPRRAER